jgi:diguanylate cyclase (GGDEF)-like protein/PAS domain S-box-containing protein
MLQATERPPVKHFLLDVDYWRAVVEAAGLGVWDYDIVTGEKNYSPRWRQMHGLSPSEPMNATDEAWFDMLHPDDVTTARHFTNLINSGSALDVAFEYRERNAAGGWTWFMCRGRAIYHDPDGKATRFVGIDTDITAMKTAEAAQVIAAAQLQNAVAVAEIGIWTFDLRTQLATWDARLKKIFGIEDMPDLVPRNYWEQFLHPEDYERVLQEIITRSSEKSDFHLSYRIIRRDGELRYLRSRIAFVADGLNGPCFVGVNWDATEEETHTTNLKAANEVAHQRLIALTLAQKELEVLSTHDPLTALPNRRALDNYIAALGPRGGDLNDVAVMLIDVDHLKEINDRHGHESGDAVLLSVAQALDAILTPHGLVARTGGDEFVAVVSKLTSRDDLQALAQAASAAAQAANQKSGPSPTVSIGVAHTDGKLESFANLHRRADKALYDAKRAGRARVVLS